MQFHTPRQMSCRRAKDQPVVRPGVWNRIEAYYGMIFTSAGIFADFSALDSMNAPRSMCTLFPHVQTRPKRPCRGGADGWLADCRHESNPITNQLSVEQMQGLLRTAPFKQFARDVGKSMDKSVTSIRKGRIPVKQPPS